MTTLFLGGDVMTGRGVDQIMACPSVPEIHEPHVRDAREYIAIAERSSGPIARGVPPAYVWGDALDLIDRVRPDARLVNLETSVTRHERHWAAKSINYRMHPANVSCLAAARIDACALANNHVLDYGQEGLLETLDTLDAAGIATAGAGRDLAHARMAATVTLPGRGRLLVFSFATESSGVPAEWAAADDRPGIDLLPDLSDQTADGLVDRIARFTRAGDLVVASIHWGGNWGWDVPDAHVRFAHRLLDANVDVVHGHSAHHPLAIEVYRDKLVLFGCGDLIDDYEGIAGYAEFNSNLVLLYFATLDPAHRLVSLRLAPMRIDRMRLTRASRRDAAWLEETIARLCAPFGCRFTREPDGMLLGRRL